MIINKIILITGMHCISCASFIAKNLTKKQGIIHTTVNFTTQIAISKFENSIISFDEIIKVINKQGYKIIDDINNNIFFKRNLIQQNEYFQFQLKTIYSFIFTLLSMILSTFLTHIFLIKLFIIILSSYIIFFIEKIFFIKA